MRKGLEPVTSNEFRYMDYFPSNRCTKLWLASLSTLWPCVEGLIKGFLELTCSLEERRLVVERSLHPRSFQTQCSVSNTVALSLAEALRMYQDNSDSVDDDRARLEIFLAPMRNAAKEIEAIKGLQEGQLLAPFDQYVSTALGERGHDHG